MLAPADVQIRFVQKGRRAQRERPAAPGEMVLRQTMELSIEHREELVARRLVSGLGGLHEAADVRAGL